MARFRRHPFSLGTGPSVAARAPIFRLLDLSNGWDFFVAVWGGFGASVTPCYWTSKEMPSHHSTESALGEIFGLIWLKRPEARNFGRARSQPLLRLFCCRLVRVWASVIVQHCICAEARAHPNVVRLVLADFGLAATLQQHCSLPC